MVSLKGASALLLVLAALIGVLIWMNRQHAPAAPHLFTCDISNTLDVAATDSEGRVVEVSRPDLRSRWVIVRPSPGPAEPEFANQLAEDLHSIQPDDVLGSGDPAQYGLDRPSRTVTCRVSSGSSFTLTVGKERFDGGGYYAQKSGDPHVYVISSVPVDDFDNRLKQPPYLGNYLPSPSPTT